MAKVIAYLKFNEKCREAMNFYRECIGGDLSILTAGDSPIASQMPEHMLQKVMHSTLTNDDIIIMASEMNREPVKHGCALQLLINCDSEEQITTYYNKLSEGGSVMEPLAEQFWGSIFGAVTDKYGFIWIFNFDKKAIGTNKEISSQTSS